MSASHPRPTRRVRHARLARRRRRPARRRLHRARQRPCASRRHRVAAVDRRGRRRRSTCDRSGLELELRRPQARRVSRSGAEVSSAVFDRVRTCDNHCEFCFIYQLPKGMRRSLYLKDDDYRLELPVRELHDADPFHRGRPRAGRDRGPVPAARQHPQPPTRPCGHACCATSAAPPACAGCGRCSITASRCAARSWCVLASTTAPCSTTRWPACSTSTRSSPTLAVVPLGVSRFNPEQAMRPHTRTEAAAVVDAVEDWQDVYQRALGRRLVHAADEYYLLAERPFPPAERYDGFTMHEDGIGMARTFELEFDGPRRPTRRDRSAGSSPPSTAAARLPRPIRPPTPACARQSLTAPVVLRPSRQAPVAILTGELGAKVLAPLVDRPGPGRRPHRAGRATSSSAATPASPA